VPVNGAAAISLSSIQGEVLARRAARAASALGCDILVVASDDAFDAAGAVFGVAQRVVRPSELPTALDIDVVDILVVHDPLCPLTPSAFLVSMASYGADGVSAVGVLAVTDTIKAADGPTVVGTLDRAGLARVASPLVAAGADVRRILADPDSVLDVPALAGRLARTGRLEFVTAPPPAARVGDPGELDLLESVDEVRHLTSER
jgi:2-C-methyl-D-erythritol 4-phosphate cytidylyltransferase